MKNLILYIFLILSSCEENESDEFYWGKCSAQKNQADWNAKIRAARNTFNFEFVDILMDRFNEQGFHRDDLAFIRIPIRLGRHSIFTSEISLKDTLFCSFSTSVDDGDVAGDRYNLITTDTIGDYIEITKIEGDQIYGSFEVSLKKDTSKYKESDFSSPFRITFRNGSFHTRITK